MTKARNMADIVGGGFAIPSTSLGNAVPADGSITTAKLADGAVHTAKIADDAIHSSKIADDAVVSASIADDAITSALIADNAVTTDKIVNDGNLGARNLIINGNFSCWQRSTDSETTGTSWAYRTVDRFQINRGRYRKTSDTVDGRTVDVVQIDPASGTYHGGRGMFTKIEDYNVYDKPTVLSVYVKADAATTAEIGQLYDYGGGSTVQAGTSVNITTDWQRFEVQYSAQTFSQAAANYIVNALVDGRTYYVAMAQLEIGDVATPFEHESYAVTLQKCQRYYYNSRFGYNEGGAYSPHRDAQYGHVRACIAQFPVTMRATPSVSIQSSNANSMDRFGRGQETCYPKADNIYPEHFQNIVKYTNANQTTTTNWADNGNYINRAGYKADAEL